MNIFTIELLRIGGRHCSLLRRAGKRLQGGLMESVRRLALLGCLLLGSAVWAQQVDWYRLYDRTDDGIVTGNVPMAADADAVYVVNRPGPDYNAVVRKVDFAGRLLWTRPLQLLNRTIVGKMVVDSTGLYVTGITTEGGPGEKIDGFLARLDLQGNLVWWRVPDDGLSPGPIALHASGIYVAGSGAVDPISGRRFTGITRFDRTGRQTWPTRDVSVGPMSASLVYGLAVNDAGIFVSGTLGGPDAGRFDFDGRKVTAYGPATLGNGTGALVVDATGVYVMGGDFVLRKYALGGKLLWKRLLHACDWDLAMDRAGDVYCAGYEQGLSRTNDQRVHVRRLNRSGSELWAYVSPWSTRRQTATAVVPTPAGVFVAGHAHSATAPAGQYLQKMSQRLPAQQQLLRDLNGNGHPELAVLQHDPAAPAVSVQIRDMRTGSLVRRINFDAGDWPRQIVSLPDVNGNGADEVVLLGANRSSAAVTAQVRDARTGALIRRIAFDSPVVPGRLIVLPDLNGNGSADLALMRYHANYVPSPDHKPPQAELRDGATGAAIRRVPFEWLYYGTGQDFLALQDADGNGAPELVVLDAYGGGNVLLAHDAARATPALDMFVSIDPRSLHAAGLPDSNGNGLPEVSVLTADTDGALRAQAFEGRDLAVRTVPFNRGGEPQDMQAVPDLNGNGYPELVVVKTDVQPGQGVLEVKDALTGASTGNFRYPMAGYAFRSLLVSDDLNGNGSSELVLLQQRRSDRSVRALIKDARTGALIRTIGF